MTLKQKWYWSEIENQSWTLINHIEPFVVLDGKPPELSDWIMFELWTFVDFDQLGLNRWLHQPGPWTGDEETTGAGSITSTGRTRFTDTHLLQSRAERNYCSYWLMCTQYSAKNIIYKSFLLTDIPIRSPRLHPGPWTAPWSSGDGGPVSGSHQGYSQLLLLPHLHRWRWVWCIMGTSSCSHRHMDC